MTIYIVGCKYCEYDSAGILIGDNEDPIAGEFDTLAEAQAYQAELNADPDVYRTYIQTSDTPL